jgi:hypothetical protein
MKKVIKVILVTIVAALLGCLVLWLVGWISAGIWISQLREAVSRQREIRFLFLLKKCLNPCNGFWGASNLPKVVLARNHMEAAIMVGALSKAFSATLSIQCI